MQILYPVSAPVKSRPFGRGILKSRPSALMPYTAADADWLVAQTAEADAYSRHLDKQAADSARTDRLCRGPVF